MKKIAILILIVLGLSFNGFSQSGGSVINKLEKCQEDIISVVPGKTILNISEMDKAKMYSTLNEIRKSIVELDTDSIDKDKMGLIINSLQNISNKLDADSKTISENKDYVESIINSLENIIGILNKI